MRRKSVDPPDMNNSKSQLGTLLLLYVVFLFYGALFPFHGWSVPIDSIIEIVLYGWLEDIFLFDIVQNLLFFLPFGLFAGSYLIMQKRHITVVFLLATFASFCTSCCIEILQTYNPARIPSLLDISLNTMSGFLGACLAIPFTRYYPFILGWIKESLQLGDRQNLWPLLGIVVWLGWGCYQLYPFIPTLHPTQLYLGMEPVLLFLKREMPFYPIRFCHYALQAMMLYFSGKLFLVPNRFHNILITFIAMMLIGKLAIVDRLLSIEMIVGCLFSISILYIGHRLLTPSFDGPLAFLRSPSR
jgi:glycopeptide antibiotics resistance protein